MKTTAATKREIDIALYRKSDRKNLNLESQILKGCLDYLNLLAGVTVWRANTGGRDWIDSHGHKRYVAFGIPGQGDITGIWSPHGARIEIEVKRPGERPKPLQVDWMRMILQHGGVAFWCDSLDMCIVEAKRFGLVRG